VCVPENCSERESEKEKQQQPPTNRKLSSILNDYDLWMLFGLCQTKHFHASAAAAVPKAI